MMFSPFNRVQRLIGLRDDKVRHTHSVNRIAVQDFFVSFSHVGNREYARDSLMFSAEAK